MNRTILLPCLATIAVVGFAAVAQAEMPVFAASCPIGGNVDADRTGTVRVGGKVATVREFNPNYYEARSDGVTYSISHEGGGRGLIVSFSASGGRNGNCTILSAGPAPGGGEDTATADDGGGAMAGAAAGGPPFWEVRVNTSLNVHSEPSTSSPTFFQLPNGSVVRNLGCRQAGGRTWCQVPTGPTDGASIGWVAAEFLAATAAPAGGVNAVIPSGEDSASADDGGGAIAGSGSGDVRVQFARGTSGAELTGQLLPQASRRYILGASDGQNLYFRLAANGPGMTYVIYNPDGSVLLDEMHAAQEYRGQLFQSGDHVVEVYNTSNGAQSYNVIFGIE